MVFYNQPAARVDCVSLAESVSGQARFIDYLSARLEERAMLSIHALTSASTQTEHFGPNERHLGKRPSLMR
jgi:hypothetical protein